ncbi:MAG: M1 family peptidase, partial [Cyclobacteriaceae bacterium]
GLVMPVIIEWSYADGSTEREKLPAEIWRKNEKEVTKVFVKSKEVVGIVIDPNKETADADTGNNQYPNVVQESRFDKFKSSKN